MVIKTAGNRMREASRRSHRIQTGNLQNKTRSAELTEPCKTDSYSTIWAETTTARVNDDSVLYSPAFTPLCVPTFYAALHRHQLFTHFGHTDASVLLINLYRDFLKPEAFLSVPTVSLCKTFTSENFIFFTFSCYIAHFASY